MPQRSGAQVLTHHLHFLTLYLPLAAQTHSHLAHDVVHSAGTSKEPDGCMARGAPKAGVSAKPTKPMAAIEHKLCNLPMLPPFSIKRRRSMAWNGEPKATV
jgi:hypothetical protein